MKILYITQYFPPEIGAPQNRAYEMAKGFIEKGKDVTVITEMPNYPHGVILKEFQKKFLIKKIINNIKVFYVWVFTSKNKNFITRLLLYFSFMINSIVVAFFCIKNKFDIIYITSPPLFVGVSGLLLKVFKKKPMVFEVRDLWPESAVEMGELQNKFFIRLSEKLEYSFYKNSIKIFTVTEGIKKRIIEKGIPESKIELIPNGTNTEIFFNDQNQRNLIRNMLNLNDKFIVVYAGVFGLAQGLEILVNSAKILKSKGITHIHYLMIGEGPKKKFLLTEKKTYSLDNVTILNSINRVDIYKYLSCADISVVPLRKIKLFNGALPSKIFDSWACELPVVITIDGEARDLITKADAGFFIPPEDAELLTEKILQCSEDVKLCKEQGKNGRNFVEKYYSRKKNAEKVVKIFEQIIKK